MAFIPEFFKKKIFAPNLTMHIKLAMKTKQNKLDQKN